MLLIGVAATFADLLAWYGISTWLTQLMREFQIPFNAAMQLMLTLNIGAVLGAVLTASLAIRLRNCGVAIAASVVSAVCLALLATRLLPDTGLFVLEALLRMSAISGQNLVNALLPDAFPVSYRAAAVGITLGIGLLGAVTELALGGVILAGGHAPGWALLVFALLAYSGRCC